MKLNEFEEKLATVSDAKLRQMLTASRVSGPDVAVKLILAECTRRGMDDLEGDAGMKASSDESRSVGSETAGDSQEQAGYAGETAPVTEGAPATAPDWLNEETKSGMPVFVKVLLVLIVLGAILGLAWKFSH